MAEPDAFDPTHALDGWRVPAPAPLELNLEFGSLLQLAGAEPAEAPPRLAVAVAEVEAEPDAYDAIHALDGWHAPAPAPLDLELRSLSHLGGSRPDEAKTAWMKARGYEMLDVEDVELPETPPDFAVLEASVLVIPPPPPPEPRLQWVAEEEVLPQAPLPPFAEADMAFAEDAPPAPVEAEPDVEIEPKLQLFIDEVEPAEVVAQAEEVAEPETQPEPELVVEEAQPPQAPVAVEPEPEPEMQAFVEAVEFEPERLVEAAEPSDPAPSAAVQASAPEIGASPPAVELEVAPLAAAEPEPPAEELEPQGMTPAPAVEAMAPEAVDEPPKPAVIEVPTLDFQAPPPPPAAVEAPVLDFHAPPPPIEPDPQHLLDDIELPQIPPPSPALDVPVLDIAAMASRFEPDPRLLDAWQPWAWVALARCIAPASVEVQQAPQGLQVENHAAQWLCALWPPQDGEAPLLARWPELAAVVGADTAAGALQQLLGELPPEAEVWAGGFDADWALVADLVLNQDASLRPAEAHALRALAEAERQATLARMSEGYERQGRISRKRS